MSTTSELKKIAIALGGTGKGSSTAELIDEIEDQIASGHGGGSGGGVWWVTMTYDDETDTWIADKSFSEIVAAVQAGNNVMARTTYTNAQNEIDGIYHLTQFLGPGGDYPDGEISFYSIPYVGANGVRGGRLSHVSGNTWETGSDVYPQS